MREKIILMLLVLFVTIAVDAREFLGDTTIKPNENWTYKIEIKRGNSDWEILRSHDAIILWGTLHMSFAKFEDTFKTPVVVRVTKLSGKFQSAEVRPKSYNIIATKTDENSIAFTLDKPQKVSIEFDEDRHNNIFLFADAVETNIPDKNDENILWYGPGVHDAGRITLKDNQTLYLHKDALVFGYFYAENVNNVKIMGRGILDSSKENMDFTKPRNSQLFFVNSSDILIKDVVLRNTPTWNLILLGCNNVHIDNLKQIGANANSDGLDIVSSSNILIENTIQRNKDDNISIKGFDPAVDNKLDGIQSYLFDKINVDDCFNITMRNCVLWADEAHNMLVGPDLKGRKAYNINFENIDVLENNQNDDVYPGTMAVMIADQGEYYDIHWKDIRVEDITSGEVISLTYQNAYAMLGYGKFLKDVTFENISYIGTNASPSRILGLNATQNIENIKFTNYRINGVPVTDAKSGNFKLNGFTKNIKFKK